jgi:hypothetical protein
VSFRKGQIPPVLCVASFALMSSSLHRSETMSNLMLPGPSGSEADGADARDPHGDHDHDQRDPRGQDGGYRRGKSRIPKTDECLKALAQLPGLVAMKLLKPAEANAIRAAYREILQHYQKEHAREDRRRLSDADVLDLMRKDPKILGMLEPLLTDEQIAMVMNGAKDGPNAEA